MSLSILFMSSACDKGSEGCIDQNACNYDDLAAIDDGNCWYPTYGCTCDDPIGSYIDCLNITKVKAFHAKTTLFRKNY